MKQVHPTFGIQLDFSELEYPRQINELIKKYKAVFIDNVPFVEDRHDMHAWLLQLGDRFLDARDTYAHRAHFEFEPGLDYMDIHYTWGRAKPQIHQDGFSFSREKWIVAATVNLSEYQLGEQAGGTLFYNSQYAYEQLDPVFKEYLKTLYVSHIHSRDNVQERDRIVARLRNKFLGRPERFDKLHRLLKKSDKNWRGGDFEISPLIQTDEDGTWMNFSAQGNPQFVNVDPAESNRIRDILIAATEVNPYYHQWSRHQLGIWENKCLIHGRADDNVGDRRRPMWRMQYQVQC